MKDTIFISHANPENNYFANWLACKLKLFGYNTWVDVRTIRPGEYFNRDFETAIRKTAIKFLAIVSKDYIRKANLDDTGVMNEILCARTIKAIDSFIIPLKYDDSDYSDFPVGLRGRQAISFEKNWQSGLLELLDELGNLNINNNASGDNLIKVWHEGQKIKSLPLQKEERYYTNWFRLNLPEYVYVHQPEVFIVEELATMPHTFIIEGDRIITFASKLTIEKFSSIKSSQRLRTSELFSNLTVDIDKLFKLNEPNKKIVRLINKIFKNYLIKNHLKIYSQANKKEVFFFPSSPDNSKMINLKQIGKSRRVIQGETSEYMWHFGISHAALILPFPCLRIFYHLVFTDVNGKYLDADDQQQLRRSFPSGWYNRKWLETLLAMMLKISNYNPGNKIRIGVDENIFMDVNIVPVDILSPIGYLEPNDDLIPDAL